jgi:hypothetical protein
MNDEGNDWSEPNCVLCSWDPDLDTGESNLTDKICSRCRDYDMATSAHRVRESRDFYLKQAEACEARASSGSDEDVWPFSRAMWERTARRWRLAAQRGFRWIPNTGSVAVFIPQRQKRTSDKSDKRIIVNTSKARPKKQGHQPT